MSIYSYDNKIVAEQIAPPTLRQSKFLAWLYVITKPVQSLWDFAFNGYKDGSTFDYDLDDTFLFFPIGFVFTKGDVIKYSKGIYVCIETFSFTGTIDLTKFNKLQDNFLGVEERIKYNSQKILFEYAMNTWFSVPNSYIPNPIFITNNFIQSETIFLMGGSSETSSVMPNNSVYSVDYMGNVPAYIATTFDFTINVPLDLFNTLGTNAANKENTIRQFADKYNLAGTTYNVITY
jgi:hypothetical protein